MIIGSSSDCLVTKQQRRNAMSFVSWDAQSRQLIADIFFHVQHTKRGLTLERQHSTSFPVPSRCLYQPPNPTGPIQWRRTNHQVFFSVRVSGYPKKNLMFFRLYKLTPTSN